MPDTYSYSLEAYAWISNVDKTAIKLNPVLEQYGYHFIAVSLEELEKKFSNLLGFPVDYKSKISCSVNRFDNEVTSIDGNPGEAMEKVRAEKLRQGFSREEIESTISSEFFDLLMHNLPGGRNIIREHGTILLKKTTTFEQLIVNNTFNPDEAIAIGGKMQQFVRRLIQAMRLYKNGDVINRVEFQITADTRRVTQRYLPAHYHIGGKKFVVDEEDIPGIDGLLKENISPNQLTELALNTFNLAYSISDPKSRYLNYMICLESLFNRYSIEISHTVSRHLALIISGNETELNNNYYKIKNFYKHRNKIIHGGEPDMPLSRITDELQDLVRIAINYCRKIKMSKDELFDFLNSKGVLPDQNTKRFG